MATTNFVWDVLSGNVLLETDGNNAVTASYLNRSSRFGELISSESGHGGTTKKYYH